MNKLVRLIIIFVVLLVPLILVSAGLAAAGDRPAAGTLAFRQPAFEEMPSIGLVLSKTIGQAPGPCSVSDTLTVIPGSQVNYCFTATNTSLLTLTTHTLVDSHLGSLLNDAAVNLPPGASYTFSTTALITESVVNTATWTALNIFNAPFTATDIASVTIFTPTIALTKTVSATPGICGTSNTATIVPGELAFYCFEVVNTGPVTVTSHTLDDDQLGLLLSDFPLSLPPGASFVFSTTAQITDPVTNLAVWTAQDDFSQTAQASDSAAVDIFSPSLSLSKTAGTTPGLCPGSDVLQVIPGAVVNYCFEITNTGLVTLTNHTLTDNHLGLLLLNQPVVVPPATTFTFSTTAVVTESVVNTGLWTASDAFGHLAGDSDVASVSILLPDIVLTKTVSATPGICAPTQAITVALGSSVTYCYAIQNTSQVTVTSHTLIDDQLGTLFTDTLAVVGPGQTYIFSTTVPITVSTVNVATWTAQGPVGYQAQAVDSASVVVMTPGVDLDKTVLATSGVCPGSGLIAVVPGSSVQYCFLLQNTGTTTLTQHTLVDDHLGTLLNAASIIIPPGGSHLVTATAVITQPVTNIATWTATDVFSNQLMTGDSATVNITGVSVALEKTVSGVAGVCGTGSSIAVPAGTSVTYCFEITNTGLVTLTTHTLVDTQLGLLLNGVNTTVGPGATYTYSETVVVNSSVTNFATWTSMDTYGNTAIDTDSASVTIVVPGLQVSPGMLTSRQSVSEVVTVTLYLTNTGTLNVDWSLVENQHPTSFLLDDPSALGDVLFSLDFGVQTGSDLLTGVEYDGTSFWVTAGGVTGVNEANLLYQFDSTGQLTGVFTQSTTAAGFGWRDMAFDGVHLYASDDALTGPGFIEEIDPATGQTTGTTIPSPENPARALAYDPATDHFWVANYGSQIHEIDRSGLVVNSFVNTVGLIYGLAWDDVSPGGPYLWAWTFSTPSAVQIDPATGLPTGVSFTGSGAGGLGGGATIAPNLVPDRLVFIGLHQALSDVIVGYDLGVSTGVCAGNGISWLSTSSSGGTIASGSGETVDVFFDSTGLLVGFYGGNLCITSTDSQNPLVVLPLQMIVGYDQEIFLPVTAREP